METGPAMELDMVAEYDVQYPGDELQGSSGQLSWYFVASAMPKQSSISFRAHDVRMF